MKYTLLLSLLLALVCALHGQSSSERVGINTVEPQHPVHIQQVEGSELSFLEPVMKVEYTGTNPEQVIAISGNAIPNDGAGIGGYFQGGFLGVYGRVISNGNLNYSAIAGHTTASGLGSNSGVRGFVEGTGTKYGLSGDAIGDGTNYGLYANAEGGTTNWAGYFNAGDVYIQNKVGVGTLSPTVELDVVGSIKITDGTQGAGKILTSNESGEASWQEPPNPSPINYPSVSMCCQTWMTKNLDVDCYRNGDPIPHVTDPAVWGTLNTGAYCYFNNDSATYAAVYGKLYNWHAVNDPRGLAPDGWHIPTYFEINSLVECLGDVTVAGGHLKTTGTSNWNSPNTGATNRTGFNAVGGGVRDDETGNFVNQGISGTWWYRTPDGNAVYYYTVQNSSSTFYVHNTAFPRWGFSVRCIKD